MTVFKDNFIGKPTTEKIKTGILVVVTSVVVAKGASLLYRTSTPVLPRRKTQYLLSLCGWRKTYCKKFSRPMKLKELWRLKWGEEEI